MPMIVESTFPLTVHLATLSFDEIQIYSFSQ
jgi:hypothetical protein